MASQDLRGVCGRLGGGLSLGGQGQVLVSHR